MSTKPWAACRHTHPAIDAASQLHPGLDPSEVAQVLVETYPTALTFADEPTPTSTQAARFSLQHVVAVALLHGEPSPDHFDAAWREDPAVADLRSRVAVRVGAPQAERYPSHWGARVTVTTTDGATREALAADALGDPEHPLSAEAQVARARALLEAAGADAATVDATVSAVLDLPVATSLDALADALRRCTSA